jgi:uncharacterized membrane-anchored protein YjiN (DUF445 family)
MVKKAKTAKPKKEEPIPVFASEANIASVRADIKELENMLEEDKRRPTPKITNPTEVRSEIIKKQQYIERNSPSTFRGEAANRAYKEAKELEKLIKNNMPKSSEFYQQYPKGTDSHLKAQKFEEAVRKQVKFQSDPAIQKAVLRYKYLMSRLSGGDPATRNIERLRANR